MRHTQLIILLLAIAFTKGDEVELNENGCPVDPHTELLLPHNNCNKFYQCRQGVLAVRICPKGLVFNVDKWECDWPFKVDCGDREIGGDNNNQDDEDESNNNDNNDDNGDQNTGNEDNENVEGDNNGEENNNGGGNADPSEAPGICGAEGSDGVLVAHENCGQFYKCDNGLPVAMNCYSGLHFNPETDKCDWPEKVDCSNREVSDSETGDNGDNDDQENDNEDNGNEDGENGDSDNNAVEEEEQNNNGGGNADPSEAPGICAAEGSDGVLVAHENCGQFYKCDNGLPVAMNCYSGLHFNPETDKCDWPEKVDCNNREVSDSETGDNGDNDDQENDNEDNGNEDGENGDSDNNAVEEEEQNNNGGGNADPSEAPGICAAEGSDGVLVAHENCGQFYKCDNGLPVAMNCYSGLHFNPETDKCDWPEKVDCNNREVSDSETGDNGDNDDQENDNENNGNEDGENGDSDNNAVEEEEQNNNGGGNADPSEAPGICAAEGSDGVLVAHENCGQFYKCDNGLPVAMNCYSGLHFNPETDKCDWPEKVDCNNREVSDSETGDNGDNDDQENDNEDNGNEDGENGDSDNNAVEEEEQNNNGGGNADPSEAPGICAAEGSDGVLVAHENCGQFYKCDNGLPVAMNCYSGLHFNPETDKCDWPEKVDCNNREVSDSETGDNGDNDDQENDNEDNGNEDGENGDSDNNAVEEEEQNNNGGGNADPSEAPGICAAEGSDGVLVAHENCGQFYKCDNGLPVAMNCYSGLHFNPETDKCDWPEKVDCNNREVSDSETGDNGDNDDQENDNEDNGNEDGENGDSDNNAVEEEEQNNNGGGNADPSEAPGICAAEGSDGVLVAHENCGQFYKCDNGLPVAMNCYSGLHFNPETDKCDWPEKVDCNNREVSDSETGDNGDNDDQENDNEDNGNEDGENGDSDNNAVEEEEQNNNGGGNADPSEAPGICAAEGSDGVLVAHENCGQFYKCDNGLPVAMNCYSGLHFNPETDKCDWPEKVDCNNREVSDSETGDNGDNDDQENDNENNGNEDGENGDSDNNAVEEEEQNNNGGGNADPSEAPGICAAEGSDGVLVAHENCGQFYKCDNGLPVAMNCYSGLHFNPETDKCDWPEKVDCNNREVSDSETGDNGDNDDQENDNEDNGNEDGENGDSDNNAVEEEEQNNNGGGNADPSEAPGICAAEGSDGVLVAHENCGQFYKCDNGLPVAMNCYSGLHFNPETDKCDWPEKVDCNNREVSDSETGDNGDNDDQENDNENNGNEDGENGDSDNNAVEEEEQNNNGGGNADPSEAPGICAAEGSDGVLVAHENCGQFYKCDNGLPVAMNCYSGLHFNPETDKCDWPEKVDCSNREVSDSETGDNGDNDDQENDNEDNGNEDGDNNAVEEEEQNNNGGGNADPSETPGICAAEGSDGVLVAHENCGQFYKCDNGIPVAMNCYGGLHFNPETDRCDWPEKVECNNREVSDNENSDNGDEDNGNEDNENDDTENVEIEDNETEEEQNEEDDDADDGSVNEEDGNTNIGGEAEVLCADKESHGLMLPHKNCNQFYTCLNGRPVVLNCQPTLLYSPEEEKCDYSENVNCGDRVIPNPKALNTKNDIGIKVSTASAICAEQGTDNLRITHEFCNKYYVCVRGHPWTLTCQSGLKYNAKNQRCDLPENVFCGTRIL